MQDISLSFDTNFLLLGNSSSKIMCNNSDSSVPDCTGYNFFYLTSDWWWYTQTITVSFRVSGSSTTRTLSFQPFVDSLFDFSDYDLTYFQFASGSTGFSSSDSINGTAILSASNPFLSVTPASLSITSNGTYDVSNYTEAVVDVPSEVIQGDYHDDLLSIRNCIALGCGVLLVIYFFFCIYRIFSIVLGGRQ